MRWRRLLITGASGTGTTTLGRALASQYSIPHADVDDYFWLPTSPPYTRKRPVEDRLALMDALFLPRDCWVLSGSLRGWGDGVIEKVDGVVFLTLGPRARMERLMNREVRRYENAIRPGGIDEAALRDFLDWARGYDDGLSGRNLADDELWLAELASPVLRLNSAEPVTQTVAAVTDWLNIAVGLGDPHS